MMFNGRFFYSAFITIKSKTLPAYTYVFGKMGTYFLMNLTRKRRVHI
nr:hypothetical protein [Tanacetum cinerariifolium]